MPRVIVVGGGLAGLVCAKSLATAGMDVEVWEASDRFGGKAGSTQVGNRWVDHGFHIFPAWYQNTNALLAELHIELWPGKDFYEVEARTVRNRPQGAPIKYRRFGRTMVASLDLISRPSWYLDELSVDGFLRGRIYAGRSSGDRLREISRKALGSPAYLTSSLTMQRNLRWWLPEFKKANWRALRGPMQTMFIAPLAEAATAAGANLFTGQRLTSIELRGDQIVPIAAGRRSLKEDEEAIVVSALPVEVLKALAASHPLVVERLISRNSKLNEVQYLGASPLSAIDLHFTRRLDELPRCHFILKNSKYDLTGLDITNVWDGYRSVAGHPTVLQLVAGDTTPIRTLSNDSFRNALIDEVQRYFRFDRTDVDTAHTVAMKHLDAPLFMNGVGSNSRRVRPDVKVFDNLYLIGDHTHTPVDLACMEGAVYSALMAAKQICAEAGLPGPNPLPLRGYPRWMIGMLKVARYPLGWAVLPLRLTDPFLWMRARRVDRALVSERQAVSATTSGRSV